MAFTKAFVFLIVLAYIGSTTAELLWQSCVVRQERVCEHETLSMQCAAGQTIRLVHASYGRSEGGDVCPGAHTSDRSCHARNSLDVLRQRCEGRSSCEVSASNDVFGDPCIGTFKFLQVVYECVSKSCVVRDEKACEGQMMYMDCSKGEAIRMIHASYGRSEGIEVCPSGHPLSTYDQSCHAQNSLEVMRQRCDGKRFCLLIPNNLVFGDPCPNTPKYLRVVYACSVKEV